MEIGSFIELQFENGKEFYAGDKLGSMDIVRLNSGRAAIYHSVRCLGCKHVYLPYYQCDTVRNFLLKKGIKITYYYIDDKFNPIISKVEDDAAVLIVNYYGVMSTKRLENMASCFRKCIIDNSQAFFAKPLENCMNVYSARKFMGVPDGAYVIGSKAKQFFDEYEEDFSSDTSLFLLKRAEYGCEGDTYAERMKNEKRIDESDIKQMSKLTHMILDGVNYSFIINKRINNFVYTCKLFDNINKLNPHLYYDDTCVPMVYPLVVENDNLLDKLLKAKHFQGHWWSYLLREVPKESFEYWLSRYIIPITIDQRYDDKEIETIRNAIK